MSQAKSGDTVHVHYTGKLDDGTVFDSSEGRDPLSFELGKEMVVPGFEKAVSGMEIGEKKTVS
ncbi:MAG: FKBP-type peptidyl-prolyl cis-trans isomerase, partial [Gemmatimonadota bacterium]